MYQKKKKKSPTAFHPHAYHPSKTGEDIDMLRERESKTRADSDAYKDCMDAA